MIYIYTKLNETKQIDSVYRFLEDKELLARV